MKVIDRIVLLRDALGKKNHQMDNEIGSGRGYIGRMIKNKGNPGSDIIEKIISLYNVNAQWLFTGNGDMFRSETYLEIQIPNFKSDTSNKFMVLEGTYAEKKFTDLEKQIETLKEKIYHLESK